MNTTENRGPNSANEAFANVMAEFGLVIDPALLPGPDTPLPPTNAALHILDHENGYGTPNREFVAMCGVRWRARESTGEHKYFYSSETHWHKHVNCAGCRTALASHKTGG
jgi:hypothetical protein